MNFFSELKDLLFIDIETVAITATFEELEDNMQAFWTKKVEYSLKEHETAGDVYAQKAGLLAEFGKVIVIGLGYFYQNKEDANDFGFRIKSIASDDEKQLLADFAALITHKFPNRSRLVAHNGREFDYPFLCRRMRINDLEIPKTLQTTQRKAWDSPHIDTMEMWRFGDRRNFTSLRLLAHLLGIQPCADMEIDGKKVHEIYYAEDGLKRIADYCRCDVRMTAEIYLKIRNLPILKAENIVEIV